MATTQTQTQTQTQTATITIPGHQGQIAISLTPHGYRVEAEGQPAGMYASAEAIVRHFLPGYDSETFHFALAEVAVACERLLSAERAARAEREATREANVPPEDLTDWRNSETLVHIILRAKKKDSVKVTPLQAAEHLPSLHSRGRGRPELIALRMLNLAARYGLEDFEVAKLADGRFLIKTKK